MLAPLLLSFRVAVISTALAALFGVSTAAMLANIRFRGREVVDALLATPLVLPPTVLGYYLLVLFGRTSALGAAFERVTGHSVVFTETGAVLAAWVSILPIVIKSVRAAIEAVPEPLLDSARALGASPLRIVFKIQLPLSYRATLASLMLAFARALGDFGATLMIAGDIPGSTQTTSMAIYDALASGHDADARTLSLVLTATAVSLLYVTGRLIERKRRV